MTFLYPNVLYALILPALLAAAAWWLWRRRSRKWEVLVSPEYRRELVNAPATWHRVLPVIFAVLASIFAILSIARPVDGYTEVKEIPKSRNILIAIDCSRSMLSKDASPTRLGRAKPPPTTCWTPCRGTTSASSSSPGTPSCSCPLPMTITH